MNQILTYIKLPLYEKEWCEFHFGSPVRFPDRSNLNSVIRYFMRSPPKDYHPVAQQEGEMAVCLPDSKSKRKEYNYYISHAGKSAIAEAIDDVFIMHMWEAFTDPGVRGVRVSKLVKDWMDQNHISNDGNNLDNLRMKFYRIKDSYRKSGVNISRGYKHESL